MVRQQRLRRRISRTPRRSAPTPTRPTSSSASGTRRFSSSPANTTSASPTHSRSRPSPPHGCRGFRPGSSSSRMRRTRSSSPRTRWSGTANSSAGSTSTSSSSNRAGGRYEPVAATEQGLSREGRAFLRPIQRRQADAAAGHWKRTKQTGRASGRNGTYGTGRERTGWNKAGQTEQSPRMPKRTILDHRAKKSVRKEGFSAPKFFFREGEKREKSGRS